MNKKQDIIPVRLKDETNNQQNQTVRRTAQKLVARLKFKDSELFIYENIGGSTLKTILSELKPNETY